MALLRKCISYNACTGTCTSLTCNILHQCSPADWFTTTHHCTMCRKKIQIQICLYSTDKLQSVSIVFVLNARTAIGNVK